MKQIFLYGMILLICSCSTNTTESKWKLHKDIPLSETKMEIQYPSKLIVDSEVYINIYFKNSDYRLQSGYINCKLDSAFSVDSTRLKITGCAVQLYRRNDSLQIYFTIPKDGIKGFSIGRATILFQDKKGKYFAADTLVGFDLSN